MNLCECGCGTPVKNRFVSGHNSIGSQNPNWRGGIMKGGEKGSYRCAYAPGHPLAYQNHVLEHRLIAEKALGKPLPPKAVVHHHNQKHLVVCQNQAYHMLIHQRMRALKACGIASWRKCKFCKEWDHPRNLFISSKPRGHVYHPECASKNVSNRYHSLKKRG